MTRRRLLVPIAAALVGTLLFAYAIRSVGWSNVVDGIRRVGWGIVPILALAGLRFVIRAAPGHAPGVPRPRAVGKLFALVLFRRVHIHDPDGPAAPWTVIGKLPTVNRAMEGSP